MSKSIDRFKNTLSVLGAIAFLAVLTYQVIQDGSVFGWVFLTIMIGSFAGLVGLGIAMRLLPTRPACEPELPDLSEILDRVRYFRPLGFLTDYGTGSVDEVADAIRREWRGPSLKKLGEPEKDLVLLVSDERRILWRDLESDELAKESDCYVKLLEELRTISRGAFEPSEIQENWELEAGRVLISFILDGSDYTIDATVRSDWIDLGILNQINPLIAASGFQFEQLEPDDQTATVLVLSKPERAMLEKDRGWVFKV